MHSSGLIALFKSDIYLYADLYMNIKFYVINDQDHLLIVDKYLNFSIDSI